MLLGADFEYGVDSDETPNMDKWRRLELRNEGDEVILKDNEGEIIDAVIYDNSNYTDAGWTGLAVKGVKPGIILERDRNETTGQYEDTNSSADWDDCRIYVVGQSHFPYETFSFNGNVTVFTSPDSSFRTIANAIDSAQDSIYLNVYQFHNFYLMDHIIAAIERGVEVKIMLEGDPVNGIADEERYIANLTDTAGGKVRFMINDEDGGIHDRYAFNHAKYAVIDNESTIVMSGNWKNTGVPTDNTFGNRGWGVIVNNLNVTNYFCKVFREDWKPASKDSFPFTPDAHPIYGNKYGSPPLDFVPNRTIPTGNYSHPFDSEIIYGEFNVSPVLAPDTSLMQTKSIIGMINAAEKSVYVEQVYIHEDWSSYAWPKRPNPFLEAAINASRRGCEVKILLNPTYSFESNQATIDYVKGIAADEGLNNLDAKFIDIERTGLNKTHNKGVIVDRSRVLISSVNWNEYSPTNNREAGLIIENEEVARFYTDVFLFDWYVSDSTVFDTGKSSDPYPSISGTFIGIITPNKTISATKLYTYACEGTGGHTEYARIWNETWNATATWNGYKNDWHNLSFTEPFKLYANVEYNFTIITGSYPQIHHRKTLPTENGWINCTKFTDANGGVYYDWIPAIRMLGEK